MLLRRAWVVLLLVSVALAARPAPACAQPAAPDNDVIRAGWQAWHAGLCYPLTGTDRHRAAEFASRAVGVPWDEFCRRAPVPAELVDDLTNWALRLRTLRRLVRLALGTEDRERMLDAFDIEALCQVLPGLRRELGTDDGVFASPAAAATFARELDAAWPQTWGNWLGRLTAERVSDVLLARTAEELFPCDPTTRDPARGERRALALAGVPGWDEFVRQAMRLPEWRELQQRVAHSAEQAEQLRQLACSPASWREVRRAEWGAVRIPSSFSSADELRRFADLFADRFPDVWSNWTTHFSMAVSWEILLHYQAGRLAGLAGENDAAGRALAERFCGVPWDEIGELATSFAAMIDDARAWGARAAALRDLLTTPATAQMVRAGRMDQALAQPGAQSAAATLGGPIRGAAFAEQFRERFPSVWQRWSEGISADEIRLVLMARAAWRYAPCAEDPKVVDDARADAEVLRLVSMDSAEWQKLAAAHPRYSQIAAEATAFGNRVAVLRRLYQHPDTFRAARHGQIAAAYDVASRLALLHGATFESAAALAAFDARLRDNWPGLVEGWTDAASAFIADEWFRQYGLGLLATPTGENSDRARQRAETFFGEPTDAFAALLDRRDDADELRQRGGQFIRSLRALRTLMMDPQTFGIVRHTDFSRIWEDPALRLIATRDGAFESPAHATEFAQLIASRYPDVWQGWLERLTGDLARTVCRTWVAGLLHRSDDQDDPEFAAGFVREQLGLEWSTLVADDFRLPLDEAADVRSFLATHTRRVRVLRELVCLPATHEYTQRMDLRGALTIPAGLRVNALMQGFSRLSDAGPAAQLFAAEFPSIWKGWRVRVAISEQRAREILDEWLAGRHAEPDAARLSDAQGERMVQAAAGTPWSAFVDELRRKPWGARVDAEATAEFGRRIAALRVLALQPTLRDLLREGRVAEARENAQSRPDVSVPRAANTFESADELHTFMLHVQSHWPSLWASWCHATDPPTLRAQLAWRAFHVAGWRSDRNFDDAAARTAMSVVTRQAAEVALRDSAISGQRAASHELSRRVQLLRQLLEDPATRVHARSLEFALLANGRQLHLDGREVFQSAAAAADFARQIRDDFPAVWSEWAGLPR